MFITAPFTRAKTEKQPKCPLTEAWTKKVWYIQMVEYYSAIKKSELMTRAATEMGLEVIVLSKALINQKSRQTRYDATHMWNLTANTNQLIYETETDSQV